MRAATAPFWFHGGETPIGVGEVGSMMYDLLPAHLPALWVGALALVVGFGVTLRGPWRRLHLPERAMACLILFDAGAHLGLAATAETLGWRAAFLGSVLLAAVVLRNLLAGRRWRLLATAMWTGSLIGYWVSSLGGHPVDQVGLLVKLAEVVGLYFIIQPVGSRSRLRNSLALGALLVLNTAFLWGAAFSAGTSGLGVTSHHTGTSPTPGMVMSLRSPETPSETDVAFAESLIAQTAAATAVFDNTAVAAAAGYRIEGLTGNDFHAPNPEYQKDGRELDSERPENLIYGVGPSGPVLLGVMFETEGFRSEPPTAGGQMLHWHRHERVCFSILPPGLAGLVDPLGLCPVGSIAVPTTNSMMHVWTVPGAPQRFGDLDEAWKAAYLAGT